MLLRFMLLILVSFSVFAGDINNKNNVNDKESVNFCLDKQAALDNEALVRKTPTDKKVIRLVALRAGLCELIGKNIIDLDFAIDLFNAEHSKEVMDRIKEEQNSNREIGV